MECILDDECDYDRPHSVNSLSRSISGTFQAVPAKVVEDREEKQSQPKMPQKFAKQRQEFCKSMLDTHSDNQVEQIVDVVRQQKVNLMAEIRNSVKEVPAVDEVFEMKPKQNQPQKQLQQDVMQPRDKIQNQQSHEKASQNSNQHLHQQESVAQQRQQQSHQQNQKPQQESHKRGQVQEPLQVQQQRVHEEEQLLRQQQVQYQQFQQQRLEEHHYQEHLHQEQLKQQSDFRMITAREPPKVEIKSAPVVPISGVDKNSPSAASLNQVKSAAKSQEEVASRPTAAASEVFTSGKERYADDTFEDKTIRFTSSKTSQGMLEEEASVMIEESMHQAVEQEEDFIICYQEAMVLENDLDIASQFVDNQDKKKVAVVEETEKRANDKSIAKEKIVSNFKDDHRRTNNKIESGVSKNIETKESMAAAVSKKEEERKLNDSPASSVKSCKLKMFEATNKGKVFSISGLWSNVRLGLVKERSNFWKSSDHDQHSKKTPNYKRDKKPTREPSKRNSRIIDPNEWVKMGTNDSSDRVPEKPEINAVNMEKKEKLQKSLSLGNLDCEEDDDEILPISQAAVVFEPRPDGRKSADIFVTSMNNSREKKSSTVNVEKAEDFVIQAEKALHESESKVEKSKNTVRDARLIKDHEKSENTQFLDTTYDSKFEESSTTTMASESFSQTSMSNTLMQTSFESFATKEESKSHFKSSSSVESKKETSISTSVAECSSTQNAINIKSSSNKNEIESKTMCRQDSTTFQDNAQKIFQETTTISPPPPPIPPHMNVQPATSEMRSECSIEKSTAAEMSKATSQQIEIKTTPTPSSTTPLAMTPPLPPQVPGRSSSKTVLREKKFPPASTRPASVPSPTLNIINAETSPTAQREMSSSPSLTKMKYEDPERAKELARLEKQRKVREEEERKAKQQHEQEQKFQQKMKIEQKLKQQQKSNQQNEDQPYVPPPPTVDYNSTIPKTHSKRMEQLKTQELKELIKLKEMERRKIEIEQEIAREKAHLAELQRLELARMEQQPMERRKIEIEQEIAREKAHLAELQSLESSGMTNLQQPSLAKAKPKAVTQYETMVAQKMNVKSPSPPPVPPLPSHVQDGVSSGAVGGNLDQVRSRELHQIKALKEKEERLKQELKDMSSATAKISLEDTFKEIEMSTMELKEMAERRERNNQSGDPIKETAGAVRGMAEVLLKAVTPEVVPEENDDDTDGYSEGAEDFSCGIEMPITVMGGITEQSSGNVTPIQDILDISTEENLEISSRRTTPLKSLLKKQSFDADDFACETISLPGGDQFTTVRERSSSPRKAVHFSEIDQVKLMSQESLVSTAPSDGSSNESHVVQATQSTCTPKRNSANISGATPTRNQSVQL